MRGSWGRGSGCGEAGKVVSGENGGQETGRRYNEDAIMRKKQGVSRIIRLCAERHELEEKVGRSIDVMISRLSGETGTELSTLRTSVGVAGESPAETPRFPLPTQLRLAA